MRTFHYNRLIAAVLAATIVTAASARASVWIWGANTINQYGNYAVDKGIPSFAHWPGARSNSVSWTDSSGNLWLFGGHGFGASSLGYLNDLFKYEPSTMLWTWMSGANWADQTGSYGTKGVPSSSNFPGGRDGSVSWIDSSDNLWLFGGFGYGDTGTYGRLNDLWKFDGTDWTWVSGSDTKNQAGTYGTKGVPNPANVPGARDDSVSWIDTSDNLWLFGGYGLDSAGSSGKLNDLWKFDGTNWTWVSGSDTRNQAGTYGTKGVPNASNVPGARYMSISWIDANGDFWLFGGLGLDSTGSNGELNDLWKFDGANWTWVSGSNTEGQAGTYGTKGVPDANNVPGARYDSISWIDNSGNLWLFGGYGDYNVTCPPAMLHDKLNDLWKFDPLTVLWTWVSGSDVGEQPGTYGTIYVPDRDNFPGARRDSVSWMDPNGNFWLFGGTGHDTNGTSGYLNDWWKLKDFCAEYPYGDINRDCKVDFVDFGIVTNHWLEDNWID